MINTVTMPPSSNCYPRQSVPRGYNAPPPIPSPTRAVRHYAVTRAKCTGHGGQLSTETVSPTTVSLTDGLACRRCHPPTVSPADGFAHADKRFRPGRFRPRKISPATVSPATVCLMLRLFLRLSPWATGPQYPRLPGPKFPKPMGHDVNDEEAPSDHQNFSGRSHRMVKPSDGPETIGGHRRRAGPSVGKAVAGPCVRHLPGRIDALRHFWWAYAHKDCVSRTRTSVNRRHTWPTPNVYRNHIILQTQRQWRQRCPQKQNRL